MPVQTLSPRESEIVELAIVGHTNDGIANELGISVGTVNTYWLRIRMKVGGHGRTDSVAKVIKDRADAALRASNVDRLSIAEHIAEREQALLELRASHALLELAMEQIKSACWAADNSLTITIIANGVFPTSHFGVTWQLGKTIYEIFKSDDPASPGVAAHLAALQGHETVVRLDCEFSNMILRTLPLMDETNHIMGCIGIMNYVDS